MPTVQEAAITNLRQGVRTEYAVYRLAIGETLDEAAIVTGWLPTGPQWTEVSGSVAGAGKAEHKHDGEGASLDLTIWNFRRDQWPDSTPVALIARWWDGSGWSAWRTVVWGYTTGAAKVRSTPEGRTGTLAVRYTNRWTKLPLPSTRMGRRDLAEGASPGFFTAPLSAPESLVPREYAFQADTDPPNLVDSQLDTLAASGTFAAPEEIIYGQMPVPRIVRFFGPHDPGVGVSGQPRFIELAATSDAWPWGTTWTGIPDMYNTSSGEGQPALRNDDTLHTTVETYPGPPAFQVFRVVNKANYDHGTRKDRWVQWIQGAGKPNVPAKLKIDLRAASSYSIGKRILLGVSDGRTVGSANQFVTVLLGADWQTFEFTIESTTEYGSVKLSMKTNYEEQYDNDIIYDIRSLKVLYGWNHDEWARENDYKALQLGLDDGAGHERWVRLSWDVIPGGNWTIPPESTVIFCDDAATLKQRFDPGTSQVFQLKQAFKHWFFKPGQGRIRLVGMGNPTNPNDIDSGSDAGPAINIENINFATNGLDWEPYESMARKNPWGTGNFEVEEFAALGFGEEFGPSYWTFSLGAFDPPTLETAVTIGDNAVYVTDILPFQHSTQIRIESETLTVLGKDEGALFLTAPATVAHAEGVPVYPLYNGTVAAGSTPQGGKTFDMVEVRRREGGPAILSGFLLYSKFGSPGDPGAGGSRWERHPDWELLRRWRGNTAPTVTAYPAVVQTPGGPVSADQIRHICLGIQEMERTDGAANYAMANELIVREWVAAAGRAGAYTSASVGDISGAIGYILAQHGRVPPSKIINTLPTIPISSLNIAPTTVAQGLASVAGPQLVKVWADGLGYGRISPSPTSLFFDEQDAIWTWDEGNCWGLELNGDWEEAYQCAQVIIYAKEPGSLRRHTVAYPEFRLPMGNVLEMKDITVSSREQAIDLARAAFREANTRRSLTIQAGAVPWLQPYQRHIVNLAALDPSGWWSGLNVYVAAFSTTFSLVNGIPLNRTAITLREMAL